MYASGSQPGCCKILRECAKDSNIHGGRTREVRNIVQVITLCKYQYRIRIFRFWKSLEASNDTPSLPSITFP